MRQLTPKMGARVVTKAYLVRTSSYGLDAYGRQTRLKIWKRIEPEGQAEIHGIYVGRRMKSNGSAVYHGPEEGVEYKPVAYFEVWLVAYADNRDILVCLPTDIVLEQFWHKGNDNDTQGAI